MLRLAARNGGVLTQARRRLLCAAAEAPAAGASYGASPRVAALVDDLVGLNMLEVKALTDALKDRLGIDDAALAGGGGMAMMSPAMMAAMAGGGGSGGAAEPAEAVVEKTAFDMKLDGYDAAKKIAVIKEIRSITGLGLKEAKALVDEAPKVFKTAVPKEEAEEIAAKLKEIGAVVKLE
jgi:large subunit ribosomal protein L7/L12